MPHYKAVLRVSPRTMRLLASPVSPVDDISEVLAKLPALHTYFVLVMTF